MAKDKQSVQYHVLHTSRATAARLGALATPNAAASIAIQTKQAVNMQDLNTGHLGLQDLQYLQQEYLARAYYATPLVVSETAIGALCLAADEPSAFAGKIIFEAAQTRNDAAALTPT
eukprot:gene10623-10781_t